MVTATRHKDFGPNAKKDSLYGTLQSRFFAFLIDSTILLLIQGVALYQLVGIPSEFQPEERILDYNLNYLSYHFEYLDEVLNYCLIFLVLHWLYYATLESTGWGSTIGKYAMGLRVTDLRGRQISFWRASLRYLLKYISILILFSGFLLAVFTRRQQALHDLLAKTLVLVRS